MPFHAPACPTEKDALAGFLVQQQDAFRAAVFGLTDEQAGRRTTASELTVGVLVKHATAVQRSWLAAATAAPSLPVDERTQEQQMSDWQREFTWLDADTVGDALAALDDVSAAVVAAVAATDLETPVPVSPAPWNPPDAQWNVRWVWFHLVEELARHAGHADIIREALDGATMYALVAGREGIPATPWLTPWDPETSGPTTGDPS
ncbi:MAG: DinB family protein [Nocardioidaceae bacterium]